MSTRSVGTVPSSRTTWPFRNQEESVIWVLALVLLLLRVLWPNTGRHSRTTAARRAKTDRLILMDVSSPGPDYLTFGRGMNSHCSAMRVGVAAGRGDVGWRPGAWGQEHRRQDRRRYCVRKWDWVRSAIPECDVARATHPARPSYLCLERRVVAGWDQVDHGEWVRDGQGVGGGDRPRATHPARPS